MRLVSNHVCRSSVSIKPNMTQLSLYCLTRYEYLWEDGKKYRRPTKLPAPEYVDALMNWAQGLLEDEAVFPNKIGKYLQVQRCIHEALTHDHQGVPFPKNFRDVVRTIMRRLFRIYAHLYSNHFDQICALGIEGEDFLLIKIS